MDLATLGTHPLWPISAKTSLAVAIPFAERTFLRNVGFSRIWVPVKLNTESLIMLSMSEPGCKKMKNPTARKQVQNIATAYQDLMQGAQYRFESHFVQKITRSLSFR